MIDIEILRKDPKALERAMGERHTPIEVRKIIELDEKRRQLIRSLDELNNQKNKANEEIGQLKREKEENLQEGQDGQRQDEYLHEKPGRDDGVQPR